MRALRAENVKLMNEIMRLSQQTPGRSQQPRDRSQQPRDRSQQPRDRSQQPQDKSQQAEDKSQQLPDQSQDGDVLNASTFSAGGSKRKRTGAWQRKSKWNARTGTVSDTEGPTHSEESGAEGSVVKKPLVPEAVGNERPHQTKPNFSRGAGAEGDFGIEDSSLSPVKKRRPHQSQQMSMSQPAGVAASSTPRKEFKAGKAFADATSRLERKKKDERTSRKSDQDQPQSKTTKEQRGEDEKAEAETPEDPEVPEEPIDEEIDLDKTNLSFPFDFDGDGEDSSKKQKKSKESSDYLPSEASGDSESEERASEDEVEDDSEFIPSTFPERKRKPKPAPKAWYKSLSKREKLDVIQKSKDVSGSQSTSKSTPKVKKSGSQPGKKSAAKSSKGDEGETFSQRLSSGSQVEKADMTKEQMKEYFSEVTSTYGDTNIVRGAEKAFNKDKALDAYAAMGLSQVRQFYVCRPTDLAEVVASFMNEARKVSHMFVYVESIFKDKKEHQFVSCFAMPNSHFICLFDPEYGLQKTDDNGSLKDLLYGEDITKICDNPKTTLSLLRHVLVPREDELKNWESIFVDSEHFLRQLPQEFKGDHTEIKKRLASIANELSTLYSRGIAINHRREMDARRNARDYGYSGRAVKVMGSSILVQKFGIGEYAEPCRDRVFTVFSQGRHVKLEPVSYTDVGKKLTAKFGRGVTFEAHKACLDVFCPPGHPRRDQWAEALLLPVLQLCRQVLYYTLVVVVPVETKTVSLSKIMTMMRAATMDLASDLRNGMHTNPTVKTRETKKSKGYKPLFMVERCHRRSALTARSCPAGGDQVFHKPLFVEDIKSLHSELHLDAVVFERYGELLCHARKTHAEMPGEMYFGTVEEAQRVAGGHVNYNGRGSPGDMERVKNASEDLKKIWRTQADASIFLLPLMYDYMDNVYTFREGEGKLLVMVSLEFDDVPAEGDLMKGSITIRVSPTVLLGTMTNVAPEDMDHVAAYVREVTETFIDEAGLQRELIVDKWALPPIVASDLDAPQVASLVWMRNAILAQKKFGGLVETINYVDFEKQLGADEEIVRMLVYSELMAEYVDWIDVKDLEERFAKRNRFLIPWTQVPPPNSYENVEGELPDAPLKLKEAKETAVFTMNALAQRKSMVAAGSCFFAWMTAK